MGLLGGLPLQERGAGLWVPGGGGEALEPAVRRRCVRPVPGSVQGQGGRGSERPALVEGVAARGGGVGVEIMVCKGPSQPKPCSVR